MDTGRHIYPKGAKQIPEFPEDYKYINTDLYVMLRRYDTVFSFASENSDVADKLGTRLEQMGIKFYDYRKEGENQNGKYIDSLTDSIYQKKGYCAVVFCSNHYTVAKKKFVAQENDIIKNIHKQNIHYLYLISIDGTQYSKREISYKKYEGNASLDEAAEEIAKRVRRNKKRERWHITHFLFWILLLSAISIAGTFKWYINDHVAWTEKQTASIPVYENGQPIGLAGLSPSLEIRTDNQIIEVIKADVLRDSVRFIPPYPLTPYDTVMLTLSHGRQHKKYIKTSSTPQFRLHHE